ncbi:Twin-arginine translocation pathway signal [Oceaniovalibus guishaninsula JLT2003]|uniref:FAD:protein FMN transferase n=1 Tax=Oceaniovalibus guishaninsula JLT2003 TaxID=1231392 RepID=K2HE69_9RHOB|nr:FAD:protein FMN transferase [Oceaniovalibus guishaninsula]EKE44832.1 Twin-arginine translocation pathway signal [Oceaniovalibus guishaninsula JLT2003]
MPSRRRFLIVTAAALALPAAARASSVHIWQGVALGARATIRLDHPDAAAITHRAGAEISRLEDVFSLFRPQSALCLLNRSGSLSAPPFELLECLSLAAAVHLASGGRFDPTVQPLWSAWADRAGQGAPDTASVRSLRRRGGWDDVVFGPDAVTMRPGMALTLNGIAQGYIADRIAAMLKAEGLTDVLVDTGEMTALGGHPDGGAWPVGFGNGDRTTLRDGALATSAPLGTTFDADGAASHILDPRTGHPAASPWREITVAAPSAALADAASTAACLTATREEAEELVSCLSKVSLLRAIPA